VEALAPASIDTLRGRCLDEVFLHVLQCVSNTADAEEITAETFARAAASRPRFRGNCRPDAWLLTIARQRIALARRTFWRTHCLERLEADLPADERLSLAFPLTAEPEQLPRGPGLLHQRAARLRLHRSLPCLLDPFSAAKEFFSQTDSFPAERHTYSMGRPWPRGGEHAGSDSTTGRRWGSRACA
jgi:DNA-directed RNA polymerase specialized sigma24 family protein